MTDSTNNNRAPEGSGKSNPAYRDVRVTREKDMRPPHERQNNVFRDNPPEKSDPRSLVR